MDNGGGRGGVSEAGSQRELARSFEAQLIEDVIAARERLANDDIASNRRDVIRATFAAIEGVAWLCRSRVLDTALSMREIDPLTTLAMRERSYLVTASGDVREQSRFIALPAMMKLVVKQARRLSPELEISFSDPGWDSLHRAIEIRNRVTHPKSLADLTISHSDLQTIADGFHWILSQVEKILVATIAAFRLFNVDVRALLDELKNGDPTALAAYRQAIATTPDD